MSDNATAPPPYIQTIYDETHRGLTLPRQAQILTMSPRTNLIAQLEHHSPSTDGSVGICITSMGNITAVSKALYDSIPKEHRPELDTSSAHIPVFFASSASAHPLGHVFLPLLLEDMRTQRKVRVVLHALVMQDLTLPMFMSNSSPFIAGSQWAMGEVTWNFDFGGQEIVAKGV